MNAKEITCIRCPMGCRLTVQGEGGDISVQGNACGRGRIYALQEISDPRRVVTALIPVSGGELPVCPVKTDGDVPKASIDAVLECVRRTCIAAPIYCGQVIIQNVADTDVAIIATSTVNKN